ncbi:MAG: RIP metalloprotease RseP [Bacilli bacterium]|nr:RIP metalloprotease RseP [Bacilli bacterium]
MVVVYILLFILCLSILIVIHELGHLAAAKAFNVYCFDFSIGFGPAFLHKKRKRGETYFSLRCIPLGGFVSMYGESDTVPEGMEIDPNRSLLAIKKWKRAIIMVAGVLMNCILAIIVFFISEQACTQYILYTRQTRVVENGIAYNAGMRTGDVLYCYDEDGIKEKYNSGFIFDIDNAAKLTWHGVAPKDDKTYSVVFDTRTVSSYNAIAYDNFMYVVENGVSEETKAQYPMLGNAVNLTNLDKITFFLNRCERDESGKLVVDENGRYVRQEVGEVSLKIKRNESGEVIGMDILGLSMFLYDYHNTFPQAIENTFADFGQSATVIFRSIGSLFTDPSNFKNMTGPIGMGVMTTNILQDLGWGKFLYIWGLISVNLAIINILPFPGLDGWHLLVIFVEAVAHKEIPAKVKNTVAAIGLVLLITLMVAIFIKDIVMLV